MNKVFCARNRAVGLMILSLAVLSPWVLSLHAGAQTPPVINGRVGPDGKVQVNGPPPASAAKPAPQPAISPAAKRAAAQFDLAASRQRQNHPTEALAAYREYIRQVRAAGLPQRALIPAYHNMALLYRQMDDRKALATVLKQVLALAPDAASYADLASIEATDGHFAEAERDATRALTLKASPPVASAAHFVLGAVALQKHDLTRADTECVTAIRLAPNNPGAHYYHALVLMQQHKDREALAEAGKARQLEPRMLPAALLIGTIRRQLQDMPGAIAAYEETLKIAPRDREALFYRALLLQKLGRNDEAITAYGQELQLYPQDVDAQLNLGLIYYNRQNLKMAREHFAAAHAVLTRRDPHDNRALIALAEVQAKIAFNIMIPRERAAESDRAEAYYKEALTRNPGDTRLLFQLADLYRRTNRPAEAIAAYRKRLVAAPDEKDSYFGIADVYIMQQRPDEAIATWRAYRARKPEDPVSYQQVAHLLEMQGRWADAAQEHAALIARDPKDPNNGAAHLALAQDDQQSHQPEKAEAEFKLLLTYDPTARDLPAEARTAAIANRQAWRLAAWRGLAKIEEERTHYDDAIANLNRVKLEEAVQAKRDEQQPPPEVYIDIARLYTLSKRPEMAIRELTALTEVAPDNPVGFAELGAQYDAQGKTEEAVVALRKASQRAKDPLDYVLKAADVYRRHADLEKSIAEYERIRPKYPHDPRLLTPLAQVLELAGQDERALTVYAALQEANPTLNWVEDRQATILTRLKRYDEARALREKLLARSPGERQSYADLARIYTLQGRAADYLTWLKSRLEKTPGEPTLQSVLLDEYTRLQRSAEGWAYLHEVMDRHQNDRKALEAYGDTLTGAGRAAEAADVWGRLARLNPKDLEVQTEYADRLTACGRRDEAMLVFQHQIARADITPATRIELRRLWAQRLEQQGRTGDAIAQYREIVRTSPHDYNAIYDLLRLLHLTDQRDELITTCLDLLKQSNYPPPLRVRMLDTLGVTYEQMNNRAAARQNYRQALLLDAKNRVATEGLQRVGTN